MEHTTVKKKRTARPWKPEEVEILTNSFVHQSDAELLDLLPERTLKAIKNKARELNVRRPKAEKKLVNVEPKPPKYTTCDICGEDLPVHEMAMGAANHLECWRQWVAEQKSNEPILEEVEFHNDFSLVS